MLSQSMSVQRAKPALFVLAVTVVSELAGVRQIDLGVGLVILLPLLYAFVASTLQNPAIVGQRRSVFRRTELRGAPSWVLLAIAPFIARFGVVMGEAFEQIVQAGYVDAREQVAKWLNDDGSNAAD